MNYELAKELCDAGFPQNLEGNRQMDGKPMFFYGDNAVPLYYVPTLEELLQACGAQFLLLEKDLQYGWRVMPQSAKEGGYGGKHYVTPVEAVARLWLALNKRN